MATIVRIRKNLRREAPRVAEPMTATCTFPDRSRRTSRFITAQHCVGWPSQRLLRLDGLTALSRENHHIIAKLLPVIAKKRQSAW